MLDQTHYHVIVTRMGKRQIKTILSLGHDWSKSYCHTTAKRMWYRGIIGFDGPFVQHKYMTGNVWRLTNYGMILKEKLISAGHSL